ncbi:MAG: hypothetical protein ABWK01_10015 [Infirmifilum sp.]
MTWKVLTLYITRDASTFDKNTFTKVLKQVGVKQDVYVISAKPLPIKGNIHIRVPQSLPVPIRVGLSINMALRHINITEYTHIFKVDSDVSLPPDYLLNLLSKRSPLAGRGAALLLSTKFFKEVLGGRYPVKYCDDGYISALCISRGCWPPEYTGKGQLHIPVIRQPAREYAYGQEYYMWGLSFPLLVLLSALLVFTKRKDLRSVVHNLAGYISAVLRHEKRYPWWRSYRYYRVRHLVNRGLGVVRLLV